MKLDELLKKIQSVYNGIILDPNEIQKKSPNYIYRGFSVNEYCVPRREFHEIIDEIITTDKSFNLIARDSICEKVYTKLIFQKRDQALFSSNDLEELISEFKSYKCQEYEVLMLFHGGLLDADKPIQIGRFTWLNEHSHGDIIQSKYKMMSHYMASQNKNRQFISCKVEARDVEKAKELAYIKFRKLDNILKVFLQYKTPFHDLGVFGYKQREHLPVCIYEKDNFKKGCSYSDGAGMYVCFADFIKEHPALEESISMMFCDTLPEMKKRIMLSLDFLGRACSEKDMSIAFLLNMMAIEALIQYQENNYLSPSITNQIIEVYTFLLAHDYDKRIAINTHFHELYRRRSAVAHGQNNIIDEVIFQTSKDYAFDLILNFLYDEKLKKINTIKELKHLVQDLKFQKP